MHDAINFAYNAKKSFDGKVAILQTFLGKVWIIFTFLFYQFQYFLAMCGFI